MPSKLTKAARDDIQLQLEAGTRVNVIASAFREAQVYKMRANRSFGEVAPDPAQFQVQGRPRLRDGKQTQARRNGFIFI